MALEGDGLEYDAVPPRLAAALAVLATGVEALLTGRPWYGCDGSTGRPVLLSADERVPEGVTLTWCRGEKWDRIPHSARLDNPELFAAPAPPPNRKPARTEAGSLV